MPLHQTTLEWAALAAAGNDKGHTQLHGMALDTCSPHGRQAEIESPDCMSNQGLESS